MDRKRIAWPYSLHHARIGRKLIRYWKSMRRNEFPRIIWNTLKIEVEQMDKQVGQG